MAKKKLDLGGTFDATIKKARPAKQSIINADVQDVQEVDGYGHTQGSRTGAKMRRMNIILLPENHMWLAQEAKLHRATLSKYFNYLLSNTQDVQEVDEKYKVMSSAAKRINMAFSDRNYQFIKNAAVDNGISPSALINQILDQCRVK